jgi:hypothetical protein
MKGLAPFCHRKEQRDAQYWSREEANDTFSRDIIESCGSERDDVQEDQRQKLCKSRHSHGVIRDSFHPFNVLPNTTATEY